MLFEKKLFLGQCLISIHVHTDGIPLSAAFHAYGKPGKTLVETRQVLLLIPYSRYMYVFFLCDFLQGKTTISETIDSKNNWGVAFFLSLQYDRFDVGDLHRLLCCDS